MTEPPPYVFFLSYARDDADEHFDRFYQDLCENVRRRMGRSRHDPIGFRDVHDVKTGDHWPEELAKALSTCQIFLPLYSPSYFNSEFSGKEWSAFRSRLAAHLSPRHPLIVPILWLPLGARFEKLPRAIRDIQYTYAELGKTYAREGLQYLLSLIGLRGNYQRFLVEFSKKIISTLETHVLPPADPSLRVEEHANAFAAGEESVPDWALNGMKFIQRAEDHHLPNKAALFKRFNEILLRADMPASIKELGDLRIVQMSGGTVALEALEQFTDEDVDRLFRTVLAAARYHSDAAPGPASPSEIPATEVKAWALEVATESQWGRINRPLIAALPAESVKWIWLRAVEARRDLPVGTL